MAQIPLASFRGEVPKLEARVLPPQFASRALNTAFDSGILRSLRSTSVQHIFGDDVLSFYNAGGTWLGWDGIVDVAPAPVAADRIYYTGDGPPKVRDAGTVYNLALPAPAAAPTLTTVTTPDPAFVKDVLYAYTFVTSLGEESQPSPLSDPLETDNAVTVNVTGFSAPPAGRGITSIRIYRSETSATGVTSLFFVAETPIATVTYAHSLATDPLQEVIPSIDFDPPPDGLTGLVSMPNGMMAAFLGKEVYFSEPYIPHAWPSKYVLTVDYPIVGLAAFGSNLAVMTAGTPYLMQGTHPENMVSDKMEKAMPCLSRRGIVDIGYAALYPSSEGLVMITGSEAKVATANLFTREQWLNYVPNTIVAERFKGKYVFLRTVEADLTYVGNGPTGFTPGTFIDFLTSGPVLAGDPTSYGLISGGTPDSAFGEQRLGMLDFEGGEAFFVQTDIETPRFMISDEATAGLYLLRNDNRTVVAWEDVTAPLSVAVWRSKIFSSFVPTFFGAAYVRTARPLTTEDTFAVRIYANGTLIHTFTTSNTVQRLPSGIMAEEWEVELETNVGIVTFQMASTVDELMVAMQ